tara:strand:- start:80 stop:304 length:225 start_codon:yes stop_codon:yes gene_type:complete
MSGETPVVHIFRKTTNTPKRYFEKEYKSPLLYQRGEYVVKKIPQKQKPDSDTAALIQKFREEEQKERNTKKKKK